MLSILRSLLPSSAATLAMAAAIAGDASGPLEFALKANDGSDYPLAQHKGKVILLVNTASKCGFTGQYEGLQQLHATYKDRGLVVIAVPANEFGRQEPGTDAEIRSFCTAKFNVSFPLMAKTVVKGEGIHPLYAWLTTKSPKPGEIGWNFVKFLIDREGRVVERFSSRVKPMDAALVTAVETALGTMTPQIAK